MKELAEIRLANNDEKNGFKIQQLNENVTNKFIAEINGPKDTPYEGGVFKLEMTLPDDFPFKPPYAKFQTKVYHPNISTSGEICLDILKSAWTPTLSVVKVILSIVVLLQMPNPDDPLSPDAANLYKTNRDKYNKTVKEYVEKYAQSGANVNVPEPVQENYSDEDSDYE